MSDPLERLEGGPVRVLGVLEDWLFFVDALGQHRALKANDLQRNEIFSLFGAAHHHLVDTFPHGDPRIHDWDERLVARVLIAAAIEIGVIDPQRLGFAIGFSASCNCNPREEKGLLE